MTLNRTQYNMIFIQGDITVDRIAIRTHSNFSGTAVVRLGLYNAANGKPTTVVFDAGTVSCTAANTAYEITISETIQAGWYFTACNTQTAASTNTFAGTRSAYREGITLVGTNIDTNNRDNWHQSSVTGAFATATGLTKEDPSVTVFFRLV
jgi:hypothetical protein